MNSRRTAWVLIPLVAALLAAGWFAWRGQGPADRAEAGASGGNLAGASIGGAFTLVDGDGRTVTNDTLRGRWRLMYFGYTFCPDVCPVDTAKLAQGFAAFEKAEPKRAATVQPLFVTVDPARDTPAVVKQFAAAFHPRLVGLTGSEQQVAAALKTFRIYSARREGATPGSYLMDHMAAVYLFDPEGAPVAFIAGPELTPDGVRAMLAAHVR